MKRDMPESSASTAPTYIYISISERTTYIFLIQTEINPSLLVKSLMNLDTCVSIASNCPALAIWPDGYSPIYQPLRSGRIWHKVNF